MRIFAEISQEVHNGGRLSLSGQFLFYYHARD